MQKKEPKYENGIIYWKCPTCNKWLPESAYYYDSRTANKLKSQCKQCHMQTAIRTRNHENTKRINREYMRRARKNNPTKFRERELAASRKKPKNEKTKARAILNAAVKSGKVIKPTICSKCGKLRKVTAHHDDYSKPLQVKWLCYECHGNK